MFNVLPNIKQLITDPESFIVYVEGSYSRLIKDSQDARTKEWEDRGDCHTIRSSTFGMCARKAYYSYYTPSTSKGDNSKFNDATKKRLFLGYLSEELLNRDLVKLPGLIHIEQNEFPVHMTSPASTKEIIYTATTDFVIELSYDNKKYYIPVELKSTSVKAWDGFRHHKFQLEQLLTWIYNAKEQGLNVPYGVLVYVKDLYNWWSVHDTKTTLVAVDSTFKKLTRSIEYWDVWSSYMESKRANLDHGIKKMILPPRPLDLPEYLCKSCPFGADPGLHSSQCFTDINIPKEQGLTFKKVNS